MGNTIIWYQPEGAPEMVKIDFGKRIHQRMGPTPGHVQTIQEGVSGLQSSIVYSGGISIALRHTWTRDQAGTGDFLRRKLVELAGHLIRGGNCMLAEDVSYAFAALVLPGRSLAPGDDTAIVGTNLFREVLASGVDIEDREIWVNSERDQYRYMHRLCTDHVGHAITFSNDNRMDWSDHRWILVREYGSYPGLRMPMSARLSGADFVSHDGRDWVFQLDLPLEEDPATMEAYVLAGGEPAVGETEGPLRPFYGEKNGNVGPGDVFDWFLR